MLGNFSALPNTGTNASTESCPSHPVFFCFLLDDSKKDAANTNAHSKHLNLMQKSIDVIINYNMGKYHYNLCQLCHNVTQL